MTRAIRFLIPVVRLPGMFYLYVADADSIYARAI
jgi:hypothetical protein